ncbi:MULTISPECIES: hypothetical protein [unclassified Phenylobacterium]|uniref:hypothetical protein n=1 Tax=unclassified Phenylobacterium TaxID=2640670 RepID=UPI00083B690A|nr:MULTISPECIES: hypothetical protein [unclassified Phenylobacterium]
MTTIRPNLYPQTQARPQSQDSGKLAAQRAFFDALGQAQRSSAPSAPPATAAATAATPSATAARVEPSAAPTDPAQKILRPGSLLDIRV